MPVFCGVCGEVGHIAKEHGKGIHQEKDIIYLPTLIAPEFRREEQGWNQTVGGRGGTVGDHAPYGRKQGSSMSRGAHMDDDLRSTTSSPVKSIPDDPQHSNSSKRKLNMGELDKSAPATLLLTDGKEVVDPSVNDEILEEKDVEGDTTSQDSKRHKTNETLPMDWLHRRPPCRRTTGPNVYPSVELPGWGEPPDSS